jgi:hypothetical protein
MRNKVTPRQPDVALNRVLAGLEKELVDATDEEITQAAEDLGMNLKMRGSAAFIGVKYTFPKRLTEVFDLADWRRFYLAQVQTGREEPNVGDEATVRKPRKPRSYLPKAGKKDRDDSGE